MAIELGPDGVAALLDEAGIGFCFAPRFHPAFRFAGPARREVGIPTRVQPARPDGQPGAGPPAAHRRRRRPLRRADARRAPCPRRHRCVGGPRRRARRAHHHRPVDRAVARCRGGEPASFTVDPAELGLAPATEADLVGGDQAHNADVSAGSLGGEPGAHRDIVVLNAAAGLVVAGAAADLAAGVAHRQRDDRRRAGRDDARLVHRGVAGGGRVDVTVVRVPASTANLGPGFDALGMALSLTAELGVIDAATAEDDLAEGRRPAPSGIDRLRSRWWDGGAVGSFADPDGTRHGIQRRDAGRWRGAGRRRQASAPTAQPRSRRDTIGS